MIHLWRNEATRHRLGARKTAPQHFGYPSPFPPANLRPENPLARSRHTAPFPPLNGVKKSIPMCPACMALQHAPFASVVMMPHRPSVVHTLCRGQRVQTKPDVNISHLVREGPFLHCYDANENGFVTFFFCMVRLFHTPHALGLSALPIRPRH